MWKLSLFNLISLFCKNYSFSKTVLYIINRKIHGCLEIPDFSCFEIYLVFDACVMLIWVYIHTGQAWKICLATGLRFDSHCGKVIGSIPTVARHIFQACRCGYTLRVTSHKHLIHLSTSHQHSKYQNLVFPHSHVLFSI
jgi:hypothetical protein